MSIQSQTCVKFISMDDSLYTWRKIFEYLNHIKSKRLLNFCDLGRTCGAVWTFERYIDYELRGFVRETQRNVSKTECEDFCLSESRYVRL